MKKFISLAIVVFLAALITSAPASLIPATLRVAGLNVSAFGVQGTLWQGQINGMFITLPGEVMNVDQVSWTLQPGALLLGKACLTLDLRYQQLPLSSDVCFGIGGSVNVDNLKAASDVAPLLQLLGFPFPVAGRVSLAIETAEWDPNDGLRTLTGQAKADNYAYLVNGDNVVLGDYKVNLGAEQGKLILQFIPGNALIDLKGKVTVDFAGSYRANLNFIPSARASQDLVNSLQFVAARQPDATFLLDYKGTF